MIIFLDFDGVISTTRAYAAQKHIDDFYLRWLDPVACELVRQLCEQFSLQIVVSSTWRQFGYDNVAKSLTPSGLVKFLHDDWCTHTRQFNSETSHADRPKQIDDWLARNGSPNYLILDDDS